MPTVHPIAVKVEHLTFDYTSHRALDDISFELSPGSVTALVGPNGAGKTTLLRSIAALDEPRRGQIFVGGVDVWREPRHAHRMMGYLPDHFGLYQTLSARECLFHAARSRGLDVNWAKQAVAWAAERVELVHKLDELAGTLSRGQRQRLALAQAIIHRPLLLLLDEPASGLDPQARADLSGLMRGLAKQAGVTILVSSHILAELENYCTAMLVLDDGRLRTHQSLDGGQATTGTAEIAPRLRQLRIRLLEDGMQTPRLPELQDWAASQGWRAWTNDNAIIIEGEFDDVAQSQVLRKLLDAHWPVLEFSASARALQDVYLEAVGHKKTAQGEHQ
ncbi:MAG: ABC transporter ATP-binding protein [Azoarcus sp.]|jgi:ABC-2 type transport system ATP-binding protein|nr:ABC transporter ATP-binding protein [Azoarcus sp.]